MSEGTSDRRTRQVAALERWQDAENGTVAHATAVIGQTKNPFLILLMEILRQDAMLHHRAQQLMIDDLLRPAGLSGEEVRRVWGLLAHHLATKDQAAEWTDALSDLVDRPGHQQLLTCLLADQAKREELLLQLERLWRVTHLEATWRS